MNSGSQGGIHTDASDGRRELWPVAGDPSHAAQRCLVKHQHHERLIGDARERTGNGGPRRRLETEPAIIRRLSKHDDEGRACPPEVI